MWTEKSRPVNKNVFAIKTLRNCEVEMFYSEVRILSDVDLEVLGTKPSADDHF